jgi:DNA-binding transcriptional regulator YhcF (GntR family)
MSEEKIIIQIDNEMLELTGAEKDAFIAQRQEAQAQEEAKETRETARQTKLDSAITKLKALGLTESEAKIIIGLE